MRYTPDIFFKKLIQQPLAPMYCLYGEEEYYLQKITQYIISRALSTQEKTLNLTTWYGKETNLPQILTQARRYPLMASKQVIIIQQAQSLPALYSDITHQMLKKYLEQPLATSILIWLYPQFSFDSKKKIFQLFTQKSIVIESKLLKEYQTQNFILQYAQEHQYTITKEAVVMLYMRLGNDLQKIVRAFEKLFLQIPPQKIIQADHITTYVGMHKTYNIFELQRFLVRKEKKQVYTWIHYYIAKKESKAQVITIIVYFFQFFSKLWLYHQHKNECPTQLAKILQIHPYFLDEYFLGAQHYSLEKTMENIQHLHTADLQIKNIGYPSMTEDYILETLFFQLMSS